MAVQIRRSQQAEKSSSTRVLTTGLLPKSRSAIEKVPAASGPLGFVPTILMNLGMMEFAGSGGLARAAAAASSPSTTSNADLRARPAILHLRKDWVALLNGWD